MPKLRYCTASKGDSVECSDVRAQGSHVEIADGATFQDAVEAVREAAGVSVSCFTGSEWKPVSYFDPSAACEEGVYYFKVETPSVPVFAGHFYELFTKTLRNPQLTTCEKFWKVFGDPTGSFRKKFLIWKRQVYEDLELQIEVGLNEGYYMFIVLGTAGCGKSMFALDFMLKQASTYGKPFLYKKGEGIYVLDGQNRCATGPYQIGSPQIRKLLNDKGTWLVIDGEQSREVVCRCKVLLVCSSKKANFKAAGKVGVCRELYMPVWSEEEVEEFMKDYEPYRSTYQRRGGMCVPTVEEVRAQYKFVGGAARYLLQKTKMEEGRDRVTNALGGSGMETF